MDKQIAARLYFLNTRHLQKKERKYDSRRKIYKTERVSADVIRKLTCQFCKRTFRKAFGRIRHVKSVHRLEHLEELNKVNSTKHWRYQLDVREDEDEDLVSDEDGDESSSSDEEEEEEESQPVTLDKETWTFLADLPDFQPRVVFSLLDDLRSEPTSSPATSPPSTPTPPSTSYYLPSASPTSSVSPLPGTPPRRRSLSQEDLMELLGSESDEEMEELGTDTSIEVDSVEVESSFANSSMEEVKLTITSPRTTRCTVNLQDILDPDVLARFKKEFCFSLPDTLPVNDITLLDSSDEEPFAPGPHQRARLSLYRSSELEEDEPKRMHNRKMFKKLSELSDMNMEKIMTRPKL